MYVWYGSKDESHVLSEEDWSDEEKIIEAKNWYSHFENSDRKNGLGFAKGPNYIISYGCDESMLDIIICYNLF